MTRVLLLTGLVFVASCNSCEGRDEPRVAPVTESVGDAPKPPGPAWLEYAKAGEGDVQAVVKAELGRARTDGVRLLVYVGATWCEPCQRFHEAAASGALDKRLPRIRFLEFDLDRDEERLRVAGYSSQYIPMFAIPGEDGRATGKYIQGSIKGEAAADEIAPRLLELLEP